MGGVLAAALAFVILHFAVPLAYYWYAKRKWLPKPWNIGVDESYKPRVSIIVPTYNEAENIESKLNNIYEQTYSRELIEVIVVDGASRDGTPELVEKWAREHPDLKIILIREGERSGKATALNLALQHAISEIIFIADADAVWRKDALSNTVKWLADPTVGAVSCIKYPRIHGPAGIEKGYRDYYNTLRVAESKAYSTPIFHGELSAFKRELLMKVGGFPTGLGADDSHTATRIALMGYRAIIPEDVITIEEVCKKGYFGWKRRRAKHLIQHFTKAVALRGVRQVKTIIMAEAYLHLVNPWLLAVAVALLVVASVEHFLAQLLLAVWLLSLIKKEFRTWMATQITLITAFIANLRGKDLIWTK